MEVLAQMQHIHPWAGAAVVVLASMKASSESRSQKNFWPAIGYLYLIQVPETFSEKQQQKLSQIY